MSQLSEYYVLGDKHISYIQPDNNAATQYDWFAPRSAAGINIGQIFPNKSLDRSVCSLLLGGRAKARASFLS